VAQNRISDPSGERGLFNNIDGLETHLHTARGSASARDAATLAGGVIAGDQWFNTDTNILQIYNGTTWANVYTPSPVITAVSPVTTTGAPNVTVTISGLNFAINPTVYFVNAANGNKIAATGIQFVNTSTITVQTPALLQSGSPYGVQVINLDTTNGQTGSLLSVNSGTAFTTAAGLLYNSYVGNTITYPILATSSLALTFSLVSGSLPNGLSFSSAGVISGTLTAAGTFNFTIRITDTATNTVDRAFSIVVAPTPTITSFTPTNFGTPTGSQQVVITGTNFVNGSTVRFFNSTAGSFASSATIYGSSTTITATIPANLTTGYPYNVIVATPESSPYNVTLTSSGTFNVAQPPTITSPTNGSTIQSASLPVTVTGSGGAGSTTFSISNAGGTGASINGNGTNFTASSGGTVTVRITDSVGQYGEATYTLQFALYSFSTFTFGNAGLVGKYGPSLAQLRASSPYNGVSWAQNNNYFYMNGYNGYQQWVVPKTGNYTFNVAGASSYPENLPGGYGSYGRINTVSANLTAGQVLNIVVGQVGQYTQQNGGYVGSGAGGSGVFNASDNAIICMSGGGGGGHYDPTYGSRSGYDAPQATYGINQSGGSNGVNGTGGGNSGDNSYGGGGGGGYNGNGTSGSGGGFFGGGYGYFQGGYGGQNWNYPSSNPGTGGGFGAGGGGGGWVNQETRPGGGGGYSGGDGATYGGSYGGGGGGSYLGNYGGITYQAYGGANGGAGYVQVIPN
jgi:Putative Ig domain/IPT/TIG domain